MIQRGKEKKRKEKKRKGRIDLMPILTE